MGLLIGQQIEDLQGILLESFNMSDLEQLLRTKMSLSLYEKVTSAKKPGSDQAFDLIVYFEQHGQTKDFLDRLVDARPRNVRLRTLIGQLPVDQPEAVPRPDMTGLAQQFGSGMSSLPQAIGPNPSGKLLVVLGRLQERLQYCSDQLRWLSEYKGLHEALHTLQDILGAIGSAARDYARSRTADQSSAADGDHSAEFLSRYLIDLRKLVEDANTRISPRGAAENWVPLVSVDEESKWIAVFTKIVGNYEQALAVGDAAALTSAVEQLRALLRKSHDLNQHLLETARMLTLSELGKILHSVQNMLPGTAPGTAEFAMAVSAVDRLAPDLMDLVTEHDSWQQLELVFALAETQAGNGAYFEDWPSVNNRLNALCMVNAGDSSAKLLLDASNNFGKPLPSGSFGYLRHAFRGMFHAVDRRLLDLTEDLAAQAKTLRTVTDILAERLSA